MSPEYTFTGRFRWSDSDVRQRIYTVATEQLGASTIERADEANDRAGVDWWAVMPDHRRLGIDIKKRTDDWPDFLLEIVSVVEKNKPGWAVDPAKRTDLVLAMWPNRSLLLGYPQLRQATVRNLVEWRRIYPQRKSTTKEGERRWTTLNLLVPEVVLLDAMYPQLQTIHLLPPKDVWKALPARCWTCGASPSGRFPDGSPSYSCSHPAVSL